MASKKSMDNEIHFNQYSASSSPSSHPHQDDDDTISQINIDHHNNNINHVGELDARSYASFNTDASYANNDQYYYDTPSKNPFVNFYNSLKPINLEDDGIDTSGMTDMEKSIYATARHPLTRRLKSRHLQMIAIGGSVGTGLFVGTGYALSQGGPGSVLLGFFLIGSAMYCVVQALGEMAVAYPVSGSFNAFFSRFIDPSVGFVVGINYACSWLISLPSELIACSITITFWNDNIQPVAWVAIFYVAVISINLFGVRGYGEAEFFFSLVKVLAIVGFIIVGICITCGVGSQGYLGGSYWHNPGSFNHGFKGVCSVFISSAFSFGGTELVGLAAAETENPRRSLPKATKQVFWRITLFYIISSVIIGCTVKYTDPQLLNGSSSEDTTASPFVIAINNNGIKVLPHIMNAVILVSVLSVGNSSVYGCSRTLASLAVQGHVPKILGYIDRAGRPLVAILFTNAIGLLCFLVANNNQDTIYTWLFSLCSISAFITWGTICLAHIRFRYALVSQGRSLDEVPYEAQLGIYGSYYGLFINVAIIFGEVWVSIFPIGEGADVVTFWQNCLSLPLMLVMWIGYKCYDRSLNRWWIKAEEIDLDTGRRDIDVELLKQEIAEEKETLRNSPLYYRVYRWWC